MEKKDKQSCLAILNEFILEIDCLDELRSYTNEANIFNILGLNHYEIRHSNMLAWLLNPNEDHGLGDRFLKKILMYATSGTKLSIMKGLGPIDIELMNLSDSLVYREKYNIDILLVSESNKLVFSIENKIFSKEHSNQLQVYLQRMQSSYGEDFRYILIFLSPDGMPSSDPENWIDMNYTFIMDQLERLVNSCEVKDRARLYIEDYILTLRRHVGEDKQLKEICNRIYMKHKDALDLIFENLPNRRSEISQFVNRYIEEHADEYGITYLSDSSSYAFVRFVPNELLVTKGMGMGWIADDYLIAYEIKITNNGDSSLHLVIGPGREETDHFRHEMMEVAVNNKDYFKVKGIVIKNKWNTIDSIGLYKSSEDEEDDSEAMYGKIEKELSAYLKNKMPKRVELLKKVFA